MLRIVFSIVAAAPIIIIIIFSFYDPHVIDTIENTRTIYRRSIPVTDGQWYVVLSLMLYMILIKLWRNICDFDYDTKFSFLMLFAKNKEYRKFEFYEKTVEEEYRKISNNIFPKERLIDSMLIKGSLFKEITYNELIIIVKCQIQDDLSWYSMHFIGNDKDMIISKDRKSLKRIFNKINL